MKSAIVLLSVLGIASAFQTVGCSGTDGGEPTAQSASQGLVTVVPAGAKSRAAGVAQWNLTHGGGKVTASALDHEKNTLVRFDIHTTMDPATHMAGLRVDAPGGVIVIAKGVLATNTLGDASRAALENLADDVAEARARGPVAYDEAPDLGAVLAALGAAIRECTSAPTGSACQAAMGALIRALTDYLAAPQQ